MCACVFMCVCVFMFVGMYVGGYVLRNGQLQQQRSSRFNFCFLFFDKFHLHKDRCTWSISEKNTKQKCINLSQRGLETGNLWAHRHQAQTQGSFPGAHGYQIPPSAAQKSLESKAFLPRGPTDLTKGKSWDPPAAASQAWDPHRCLLSAGLAKARV